MCVEGGVQLWGDTKSEVCGLNPRESYDPHCLKIIFNALTSWLYCYLCCSRIFPHTSLGSKTFCEFILEKLSNCAPQAMGRGTQKGDKSMRNVKPKSLRVGRTDCCLPKPLRGGTVESCTWQRSQKWAVSCNPFISLPVLQYLMESSASQPEGRRRAFPDLRLLRRTDPSS